MLVRSAEAEGFEPPDGCPSLAFKTGDLALTPDRVTKRYAVTCGAARPRRSPTACDCHRNCNRVLRRTETCIGILARPRPGDL